MALAALRRARVDARRAGRRAAACPRSRSLGPRPPSKPDDPRFPAGPVLLPGHGQGRQAPRRRGPGRREHRHFRRLRRRRGNQRGAAGAAAATPRRRPDGLHPRPADGGLRPVGQSSRRAQAAGGQPRRHRRLRGPSIRSARGSEGRGPRGDRRRPSPVREPAPGGVRTDQPQPARRERARRDPRPRRRGRHGLPARSGAAAGIAWPRMVRRRTSRAQDYRPARPGRARHCCRCRPTEVAQSRFRHPGPQGHGRASEYRPVGARRGGSAGQAAELPRPRLRAWPADQRRRPRRQVRPRRAPADFDRPRRSASNRRRARSPQRRAPGDRNAGLRAGRGPGSGTVRSTGDPGDERRLAPRRDRHRRRPLEGALRPARDRHRRVRGRHRKGLGPVDQRGRPRRRGASRQGERAADRRWRSCDGGWADHAGRRSRAASRVPPREAGGRRRGIAGRPCAAARRAARPGRCRGDALRCARRGRALWRRLARPARRGRPGAAAQDKHRRRESCPRAGVRRRWQEFQVDRLPQCRDRAWPSAACLARRRQMVARRDHQARRI